MKIKDRTEKFFDKYLSGYKWYNTCKDDYTFRTVIMSIGGAVVNVVFAGFNAVTAIYYLSLWYGVFSVYYFILAVLRISVLLSFRHIKVKYNEGEKFERAKWKIYLVNGATFVPLDIALGAAITVMMFTQKPTITGDIMAISSATYTTYKVVMAIRNLIKATRVKDPIALTVRNIGVVDALASVFSLEITLITTFSESESFESMRPLTAISGFIICAFTIGLGAYMIIKAAKSLGIGSGTDCSGENNNEQQI